MSVNIPAVLTRPRAGHHRTETIRPFVQKYQYYQLPLPEPVPAPDEESDDLDIETELARLESLE